MRQIDTDVLVIGGGATGTGVLRDLAMRGFKAVLVERRDLTHGTTGRYHGLLHSGGRYVVKDPQAARECIEENRILRKIMPHCIEDTGGFFVLTPWDDPQYAPRFVEGCQKAGIPVEEISIEQMLSEEPALNPKIERCFRVPDASADSFLAADLNAESARQYGAQVLTYHEVLRLITQGDRLSPDSGNLRVVGAVCHDLVKDEELAIHAEIVVNASGAWAGKIASSAGIPISIRPGKGTMIAINHRVVNTVINRCKMPADGDIIVPAHTVAVIGTTDEQVSDPDRFAIEDWEIKLMLDEGEKLIPGFKDLRLLRSWAGVRPLYQETKLSESRDITRAFVLLDHAVRDGVGGIVTITSGKWTTYRKMAEATVDKVCEKLNTPCACRTHLEALPSPTLHHHTLGVRLAQVEEQRDFRNVICECELATYADVEKAISSAKANTIDDIRRDTRLGMGPCQGGFCTLRAAGILHQLRDLPIEQTNVALCDFLQERWKGLQPILWGQQLRQERLDELIYLDVFNLDHLPGPKESRLKPEAYLAAGVTVQMPKTDHRPTVKDSPLPRASHQPIQTEILVIGAGLSGLVAAWRASTHQKRPRLIAKGWGAHYWGAGCIDVLDCFDPTTAPVTTNLSGSLEALVRQNPRHPYALCGLDQLHAAVKAFQDLCMVSGYPLSGTLEQNWLLPTALGSLRPTCLAPETMLAGDGTNHQPAVIVGFERFFDFFPNMIAANLEAQGIPARGLMLDLPSLRSRKTISARILAQYFESPEFRREVVDNLKSKLRQAFKPGMEARLGFPAVLGFVNAHAIWQEMQQELECPVFEIPGLPPSIPGMRLHQILCQAIQSQGGEIFEGMQVLKADCAENEVVTAWSEAAARQKPHRAEQFVLATGNFLGGGMVCDSDGDIEEVILGLPLKKPRQPSEWFHQEFLSKSGHPIFFSGIEVDGDFHPIDEDGNVLFKNLSVTGSLLADVDPLRQRSLEGIALATGYTVGERLGGVQS
jgi:glycerol-3-phosphate dehydrogenase